MGLAIGAVVLLVALGGTHLAGKFSEGARELKSLFRPAPSTGIQFFKVTNGVASLVLDGTGILIRGSGGNWHFSQLNGTPIPIRTEGDSLSLLLPSLKSTDVKLLRSQHGLPYLVLTHGGETVKLISSASGIKALAWKQGFDSVEPETVSWIPDRLFSNRGFIWSRTLPLLTDHWIWGDGPATFPLFFPQRDFLGKLEIGVPADLIVDRPHSYYLQVAQSTGWLSLLALLALFFTFFRRAVVRLRDERSDYLLAATAASAGYLTAALFNDSMVGVAPVFWIILGSGWACLLRKSRETLPPPSRQYT